MTPEHRAELLSRNAATVAGLRAAVEAGRRQARALAAETKSVQAELDAGGVELRRLPAEGELDRVRGN